jgi:protein TonB
MNSKKSTRMSFLISLVLHVIITLLLMAFTFTVDHNDDEFVTVGFGTFGKLSSSGAVGRNLDINKTPSIKKEPEIKKRKEVELPKSRQDKENNPVYAADKEKKEKEKPAKPAAEKKVENSKGRENTGEGSGKFGFELDFGGKGKRKIYSYTLPSYPAGVSKEIDVKLRFTILPDGTVGKIFPLIKADTRLESAAINSLKRWRFEPLPGGQNQADQTAVIIFPFRLQ